MDPKLTLINLIDVLLRIPSLFVLDELFQSRLVNLGIFPSSLLPLHKEADFDFVTGELNHTLEVSGHAVENFDSGLFGSLNSGHKKVIEFGISIPFFTYFDSINDGSLSALLLKMILLSLGISFSLFTLTMWSKQLVKLYEFLFSGILIVISYYSNQYALTLFDTSPSVGIVSILQLNIQALYSSASWVFYMTMTVLVQMFLGYCYQTLSLGPRQPCIRGATTLCFLIPAVGIILPNSSMEILSACTILLWLHMVIVILYKLPQIYNEIINRIEDIYITVRREGIAAFVESEWLRLNVSTIFRIFWLTRFATHLYIYYSEQTTSEHWDYEALITLGKILLVRGCETVFSVLGMASIFSWFATKIFIMSQKFLLISNEENSHVGPVSAVLFLILALQNGLSTLKPAARIVRLVRNVFLLLACLLHFIHNAVDPVLMSLAASANPDKGRHIRALAVCAALITITVYGLVSLWSSHLMSTWLLAVTGFSVEVISKVFISLALYILFLADAKFNEFWDRLDDYVYVVRSLGRALEFLVGLFLLCNSAFILLFESGGAIRAILVALHAYFNLWCEAKAGWKIFTRRRTAVNKISTLQTVDATEQLEDVCAICFHELKPNNQSQVTVKVTPCKHYFHAVCLRKWLYVQDRCPMCHQTLWPQSQATINSATPQADPDRN